MGLREAKGNMYGFVTHTGNMIKGKCYHDCSYCYMKRFGDQKPVRFDEKELKKGLGVNKYIFVGSSCDMFNKEIPSLWIDRTLRHCEKYSQNKYLFQSKNPYRFGEHNFPKDTILCTTLESNRYYPSISKAINPHERIHSLIENNSMLKKMVTIEPIMKFDISIFLNLITLANPIQVNIGANSGRIKLPEPTKPEVLELIKGIKSEGIKVHLKPNLKRITG